MKDFSSTLERQRNRERESRNPYGYWPCSHESKRENWADFALKVFIFKNCVVPHRGDNVSTYISSAKKKKRCCAQQQRWYQTLKSVSQRELPNYKLSQASSFKHFHPLSSVILMAEKQLSITSMTLVFGVVNLDAWSPIPIDKRT